MLKAKLTVNSQTSDTWKNAIISFQEKIRVLETGLMVIDSCRNGIIILRSKSNVNENIKLISSSFSTLEKDMAIIENDLIDIRKQIK